jgi:RND family efflux transporter MFP subunit
MVLKKLAEEGEIIASGYPVVLFAPSDGVWEVSSGLSDKDIVKVTSGDSVEISIDAFPGTIFNGTVYETGTFADPYTGTFTVKAAVSTPEKRFRTGMTGKMSIIPSKTEQYVSVPINVITDTGEGIAYIYLLKGHSHIKTRIKTGEIAGDRIIVKEGLAPGDVYISEGIAYLTPGCSLNIISR